MRIFFGVLLCLTIYLLPTGIAVIRKRTNGGGIFVLNLFLGWTIFGWVVSLVWAVTEDKNKQVVAPVAPTVQ